MISTLLNRLILITSILLLFSCATVPPEVIKTQQKELEIIKSLQSSHVSMIDAFVDQKILVFEDFFFNNYGPVYRKNWIESFKEANNRDYDPERDFSSFYNDLVAEYQEELQPIEGIRYNLKTEIALEYSNLVSANKTVGRWLENLKELNDSQRKTIDSFLESIKPGLSIGSIDEAINKAIERVKNKI